MPDFKDVHVRIQRDRSVNDRWNGLKLGLVPYLGVELGMTTWVAAHNVLKSRSDLGKGGKNAWLDQLIKGRSLAPHCHRGICDDQRNDSPGRTACMKAREIERVIVDLPSGRCGHSTCLGFDHNDKVASQRSEEHTSELQ